MTTNLAMLEIETRQRWRSWLEKHHASSAGVWLVFRNKNSPEQSVSYEDSVCEALCFGWIDSLIKRIDDRRHARKFTPRRQGSKWSDSNRKRWSELRQCGLMTPAGLKAAPTENTYAPLPVMTKVPPYISKALKQHPAAWAFFETLAPTYRRQFMIWIDSAKRPETRSRRGESIALLAAGQKLGLK